jgi:hypothetical protein
MEKLNVRFNDGTKAEIKSISQKTGLSESFIARAALNRGLTRLDGIIELEGVKQCVDVISTYEGIFNVS